MGMFDTVIIHDNRMKCKNGHDMSGQCFQTKNLTNTMETWVIESGALSLEDKQIVMNSLVIPTPGTGLLRVYDFCDQCEGVTNNNGVVEKLGLTVFDIQIDNGKVKYIRRDDVTE